MAKTTTKSAKTETAKTTVAKEVKKAEVKKVENKKPSTISWDEVNKLYSESGIHGYNPNSKGYRAMGVTKKGSSLNIRNGKYVIYSTNEDYENLKDQKMEGLLVEQGTNSQDSSRPNTVICDTVDVLKKVLKIYAKNPFNQVVTTK